MSARGIVVSYETIRAWVAKFGSQYAKVIRRDRPKVADKWHLDEVVLPINGKKYWLWRAVDSKGDVLDILGSLGAINGPRIGFSASYLRHLASHAS